MCPNTIYSHFINVIIKKSNNILKINDNEFIELNHIIRSSISNTNNNKLSFVDNKPFEKYMIKIEKKNVYIEKQTNIINKRYLSVLKQHIEYSTL